MLFEFKISAESITWFRFWKVQYIIIRALVWVVDTKWEPSKSNVKVHWFILLREPPKWVKIKRKNSNKVAQWRFYGEFAKEYSINSKYVFGNTALCRYKSCRCKTSKIIRLRENILAMQKHILRVRICKILSIMSSVSWAEPDIKVGRVDVRTCGRTDVRSEGRVHAWMRTNVIKSWAQT